MPSIGDFVDNRWTDAKEELRKLDSDFVSKLESEHRLQTLGLGMPQQYSVGNRPKRPLAKEWHRLLEDCDELVMQETILQTVVDCFIDDSNRGLPPVAVGKRFFYHMHSWFIHADTLIERTQSVIRKTTYLYIPNRKAAHKIAKRHCNAVSNNQLYKKIGEQRNQFAHGTTRSWGQGVTEEKLWEGSVAFGMTPQLNFDQFLYPNREKVTKSYGLVVDGATKGMLDHIGEILHAFEMDIAYQWVEG